MKSLLAFFFGVLCGGVIVVFAYPYILKTTHINRIDVPKKSSESNSLMTQDVTDELKRLDSCRNDLDKRKDTLKYIKEIFYQKSLDKVQLTKDEQVVLHLYNKLISISNSIDETERILINQSEDPNLVNEFNKYYRRAKQIECPNFDGIELTYTNIKALCEIITKAENLIDDPPFEGDYATKAEFTYELNRYNEVKQLNLKNCKSPYLEIDRPF